MRSTASSGVNTLIAHSLLSGEELVRLVRDQYGLSGEMECALFAIGVNDIYRIQGRGQEVHSSRFSRPSLRHVQPKMPTTTSLT